MGLQGGQRAEYAARRRESAMVGSREETTVMRPGGASDGVEESVMLGWDLSLLNFISSASVWGL